ncbi:glyoxalase superfamily protein [Paenibacillus tuaregi]|uniref:glyoxalase superfamily protein n=1 Tax=Paenibacillus tuaregi TaxID=1816681 RepID=UPI000839518B|nr:glyoxalase superfamily protein [Paenibacillus tuaregi]
MALNSIIPVLRIFDEEKALQFYIDFLGFTLDWKYAYEPGFPQYMQISKDGIELHLSEHHGDGCPGAALRIEVDDIKTFQQHLVEKEYKYAKPDLESTPWQALECRVTDPFGNRLIFYEDQYEEEAGAESYE